jgi:hypothetical protein
VAVRFNPLLSRTSSSDQGTSSATRMLKPWDTYVRAALGPRLQHHHLPGPAHGAVR